MVYLWVHNFEVQRNDCEWKNRNLVISLTPCLYESANRLHLHSILSSLFLYLIISSVIFHLSKSICAMQCSNIENLEDFIVPMEILYVCSRVACLSVNRLCFHPSFIQWSCPNLRCFAKRLRIVVFLHECTQICKNVTSRSIALGVNISMFRWVKKWSFSTQFSYPKTELHEKRW